MIIKILIESLSNFCINRETRLKIFNMIHKNHQKDGRLVFFTRFFLQDRIEKIIVNLGKMAERISRKRGEDGECGRQGQLSLTHLSLVSTA